MKVKNDDLTTQSSTNLTSSTPVAFVVDSITEDTDYFSTTVDLVDVIFIIMLIGGFLAIVAVVCRFEILKDQKI